MSDGKRAHGGFSSSIGLEAVQQAAEEVHEADRQVDVRRSHQLPAVAPHKGDAGVHQPLKEGMDLYDTHHRCCYSLHYSTLEMSGSPRLTEIFENCVARQQVSLEIMQALSTLAEIETGFRESRTRRLTARKETTSSP